MWRHALGSPQVTRPASNELGADPGEALEWRQSYLNVEGQTGADTGKLIQPHP